MPHVCQKTGDFSSVTWGKEDFVLTNDASHTRVPITSDQHPEKEKVPKRPNNIYLREEQKFGYQETKT